MRSVCWQTIFMKYHTLFFSKIRKDVVKFVVCCSRDKRFKSSKKFLLVNFVIFQHHRGNECVLWPHSFITIIFKFCMCFIQSLKMRMC